MTVAKLRGSRERMRKEAGKCEGRKAFHEMEGKAFEAALMARGLRRANLVTHKRKSLREIAAELAKAGYLNERGRPYNPKSIMAMVNGPRPKKADAEA